jgi:hypothetical protein
LPRLLRGVQRWIDALCFTGFAVGALLGPGFVKLLYTETYHVAGYFVSLLSLSFLCLRFEVLNNLLLTLGDGRGMMWLWMQRAAVLILFLPLCYNVFGLSVALVFTAIHPIAVVPFLFFRLRHIMDRRAQLLHLAWVGIVLVMGGMLVSMSPLNLGM